MGLLISNIVFNRLNVVVTCSRLDFYCNFVMLSSSYYFYWLFSCFVTMMCVKSLMCAQMAGLCWTAAVLLVFLSAGNTSAAVDQNWLASIIEGIKNE